MRGALKKPAASFSARIQNLAPGSNPAREIRAKNIAKHNRVDHFGSPTVKTEPTKSVIHAQVTPRHNHPSQPLRTATASNSTAVALPSMVSSASHQKLERMLDVALTRADAHKQALRYQAARHFWQRPSFLGRRTGLKLISAAVVLLIIIGFLAWRQFPVLSVKMAGAKAHVNASVPAYKPDGYSLAAPASAQNGTVIIKYKDAHDASQTFTITQQPSSLTSSNISQTVVPHGAQVQTSQVGGNTVYMYGASNDATWVNDGVLYMIHDNAQLTSDQIINIVQGLN